MKTIDELLRDHVTLEVECMDRLYLNGYIPRLQTRGQLMTFMMDHLGLEIPSPAILAKIAPNFRQAVREFANDNAIPIVRFEHGQRKDDIAKQLCAGRGIADDVVFIGVAQEKAKAFEGRKRDKKG